MQFLSSTLSLFSGASVVIVLGAFRARLARALHSGTMLQPLHQRDGRGVEERFAASDEAVVGVTSEGIIISWNAAAEQLSGYTAREIIGQHLSVMATPETRAQQAVWLAQACHGEAVGSYELTPVGKDGRPLAESIFLDPLLTADGSLDR